MSPRLYVARARFLLKNNRAPVLSVAGNEATPAVSDAQAAAQLATELQLLAAPGVLRAAALEFPPVAGTDAEAAIQARMEQVEKQLKIDPVLRSNLIEVKFTDSNPELAIRVLQAVSKEYLERQIGLRGGKENFEVFSRRAAEAALAVEKAQENLKRFQTKTEIVAFKEQRDVAIHSQAVSSAALNEARALEAELEKRAVVLRSQIGVAPPRISTTLRAVPNQYSVERLTTLVVELGNKRTELLAKFRPDDRLVLQIERQIEETRTAMERAKSLISKEETSDVNPLRQQAEMELARTEQALRGARARAEALASQAAGHRSTLLALAVAGPRDADLIRQLREAEENHAYYSKKRDQLRVDKLLDDQKIADVMMVEAPTLPRRAKSKVTPAVLALFTLINGGLVFAVVLTGLFSRTFTRPSQLERYSGVPVLGTLSTNTFALPSIKKKARRGYYLQAAVERIRAICPEPARGAGIFFVAGVNGQDDTFDALRLMASDLAAATSRPVLVVPSSIVIELNGATMQFPIFEARTGVAVAVPSEMTVPGEMARDGIPLKTWLGVPSTEFSYILVESPPLDGSVPLPAGLRRAQGIFLVATAGQCLRFDVSRSLRFLRSAGCEPTGFVMRNRTYPIPDQVYRYL